MKKVIWLLTAFLAVGIILFVHFHMPAFKLELGAKLPEKYVREDNVYCVMLTSAYLAKAHTVNLSGTEFSIAIDTQGLITYIGTNDARFKTPEGVAIGMPLKNVLKMTDKPMQKELGWAYYVPLASGWKAAFSYPAAGKPQPNAKVIFIFKRK